MISKLALFVVIAAVVLVGGCSKTCPDCPSQGAILNLSKHKVNFGASDSSATFAISNKGKGNLSWDITISPAAASSAIGGWLDLSMFSGSGDQTISCTADRSKLEEIGISHATLTVNSANAVNIAHDSIDVFILKGGEWLITDDGSYEKCEQVKTIDRIHVKGFRRPPNLSVVIVDSVGLNFCEGDTILLLGFGNQYDASERLFYPDSVVAHVSDFRYLVGSGWSLIPVNWYFADSIFFLGYYSEPHDTSSGLKIDESSSDSNSFTARLDTAGSDTIRWVPFEKSIQTFAIRVFVTPVLEYNPKLAKISDDRHSESDLATGYAYKGRYPINIKPRRVE